MTTHNGEQPTDRFCPISCTDCSGSEIAQRYQQADPWAKTLDDPFCFASLPAMQIRPGSLYSMVRRVVRCVVRRRADFSGGWLIQNPNSEAGQQLGTQLNPDSSFFNRSDTSCSTRYNSLRKRSWDRTDRHPFRNSSHRLWFCRSSFRLCSIRRSLSFFFPFQSGVITAFPVVFETIEETASVIRR